MTQTELDLLVQLKLIEPISISGSVIEYQLTGTGRILASSSEKALNVQPNCLDCVVPTRSLRSRKQRR